MFGWIEKRRLKREWRLVATLEAVYTWNNSRGQPTGRKDSVFYYLYENGVGDRKCDFKGTGQLSEAEATLMSEKEWAKAKMEAHPKYLSKVVPWLNGAYDPDIPSFATIKAKDFKDALRGSK